MFLLLNFFRDADNHMREAFRTEHRAKLVQRRIVRRGREHLKPRPKSTHDLEPETRQSLGEEGFAGRLLQDPRILAQLIFKLAGIPTSVANKSADRRAIFLRQFIGILESDIRSQAKRVHSIPVERSKHQLVGSDRTAEKNRDIGERGRRWFGDQVGDVLVERAIDDQAERTLRCVMRGNEKNAAPEIRIKHAGMRDKEQTGKILRRIRR